MKGNERRNEKKKEVQHLPDITLWVLCKDDKRKFCKRKILKKHYVSGMKFVTNEHFPSK